MNRTISRVLAAAVASAGFTVPLPTIGASLSCTSSTFTATPDGAGNITVSCSQPGTTSVGSCSISASPSVLPASGGVVSVSANCGANVSVAGGRSPAASGNGWTDTIGSNDQSIPVGYTYTVSGDNGTKSITVTQSGTGGTAPPPNGGSISCAGYSKTHVIDVAWGAAGSAAPRVLTSASGGFSANEVVVARFTTPAKTASGIYAVIKSAEWGDQQHQRIASLSATPCDFPTPNGLGRLATLAQSTPSPSVTYAVGGSSAYYAILQPATTYYFNIRNVDCAAGESCNMFIELQKPKGL
ncbi:MAG: hypothetical protein ABI533_08525 [Betaproteobacteria bacterium]